MKRLFLFLALAGWVLSALAQIPQGFNYQAILRDGDGAVLADELVSAQIRIYDGEGTRVYFEFHNVQTNYLGLAELVIGQGTSSDDFEAINWYQGPFTLEVSVNGVEMERTPLWSVPYAMVAGSGQYDPIWKTGTGGIYYNDGRIGVGTTTPENFLHIHKTPIGYRGQMTLSAPLNEDVYFTFYEADQYRAYLWWDASDGDLRLQNRAGGDLNLNPENGYVGVGTNLPAQKLDVNGNVRVRGNLTVEGDVSGNGAEGVITRGELDEIFTNAGLIHLATPPNYEGTVTDIDGNTYKTVKIGNQVWMAENLRVTHLNDGTEIKYRSTPSTFGDLPSEPRYIWHFVDDAQNAEPINKVAYGALYNFQVVETDEICPSGWHVPDETEFRVLVTYLGGEEVAGGKMKVPGSIYWNGPNTGATNESGFSALPGGFLQGDDPPSSLVQRMYAAVWWTATPEVKVSAGYNREWVNISTPEDWAPFLAASIRCIKD